ncbi:MAG TPA: 2-oxo acid dehydrogenase subunit E2, partial [Miltoncostaeaceae bacterium]|nr:2-oxo acid dehydrogenase subunit E2 [Miltoncostaeaceae bacterium]
MSSTSSSAVPVLLPEIGESVTEGVVLEWRKAVGDVVEVGEPLLEVTTDKVDVEIPAPAGGVLTRIVAQEGETVEVGALLAELDASAEAAPAGAPAPEASGETKVVPIVLADMESITEGTVVEWRVGIGDAVAVDDVLLEVSTDKVDIEVPATVAGVLSAINVSAGDTFTIGDALGELTVGAGASAGAPAAKDAPAAPPAAAKPGAAKPPAGAQVEWPAISPVARRAALRAGIDPATITGSGPGGIIRKEDVAAAAAKPATPTSSVQPSASDDVQPLRGPAAALAGYMDESLSLPTATSFRTLTVTTLDAQRRKINADLAAAGRKEKLSFTHLIAWAIVRAASDALPVMGTGFAVVDGKPHKLLRDQVHLGLAVDVERKDGSRSLMVPVVKNASQMDFRAFRDAYDDLVNRTRFGGIPPDELRGASITL